MKTERELFEETLINMGYHESAFSFDSQTGMYALEMTQENWRIWQASASREGYKLVPVDSLKIVLNCIDQDNLFFINGAFKALDDVEKAMIGASE